jgi:hypothetical protein
MSDDALTFDATVAKVQTLVDNGIRITLDLPETAIEAAAVLMALKRQGRALKVAVTLAACKTDDNRNATIQERSKRQSQWTPAQEQGAH